MTRSRKLGGLRVQKCAERGGRIRIVLGLANSRPRRILLAVCEFALQFAGISGAGGRGRGPSYQFRHNHFHIAANSRRFPIRSLPGPPFFPSLGADRLGIPRVRRECRDPENINGYTVGGCRSLYAPLANQYRDMAASSARTDSRRSGRRESVAQSSAVRISRGSLSKALGGYAIPLAEELSRRKVNPEVTREFRELGRIRS